MTYCEEYLFRVIDLEAVACPEGTDSSQYFHSLCCNHSHFKRYLDHCLRKKALHHDNWFINRFQKIFQDPNVIAKVPPVSELLSASIDKESLDGSGSDHKSLCLIKAVVEFAGQFFRKTITQLTHQDFSYLDGGIISVCTLLNYTAHYIRNDVQQSTERSNPEAQPSTPWTTNHTCFSHQTRRNRLPNVTQTNYRRLSWPITCSQKPISRPGFREGEKNSPRTSTW